MSSDVLSFHHSVSKSSNDACERFRLSDSSMAVARGALRVDEEVLDDRELMLLVCFVVCEYCLLCGYSFMGIVMLCRF